MRKTLTSLLIMIIIVNNSHIPNGKIYPPSQSMKNTGKKHRAFMLGASFYFKKTIGLDFNVI